MKAIQDRNSRASIWDRATVRRPFVASLLALFLLGCSGAWASGAPAPTAPTVQFTQLTGGAGFGAAIASDGKTYAWGTNTFGQLGDNGAAGGVSNIPIAVKLPTGVAFTKVAAGYAHAVAVGDNGKTYAWGVGSQGQLGNGLSPMFYYVTSPVQVTLPSGVHFTQVAAGWYSSLALGDDAKTYAWGSGSTLGNGSSAQSSLPVEVTQPAGITFTQLSVGKDFAVAIGNDGNAYAWGTNANGQLGNGTTTASALPTPVTMPPGVHFTQVDAGDFHTLAIGDDGNVYAWGDNANGQLGDGTETSSSTPVQVTEPTGVSFTRVAGGGLHSMALGDDGAVYTWGNNSYGQLGDGTNDGASTPLAASTPPGVQFTDVEIGAYTSYALSTDGNGYAWGTANLGNGTGDSSTAPVAMTMPAGEPAATTGTLTVKTSPAVASRIRVDGNVANYWAVNGLELDAGSHQVCFDDVPGFKAPACQSVTVTAGELATVTGTFTQLGSLRVTSSPSLPTRITIDTHPADNWGLWTDISVGSHEVCFSEVDGWRAPACQTVNVTAGATTVVNGTFTADSTASSLDGVGMLRVTSDPPVPTRILVDGHPSDTWGIDWLELPPGLHNVCFGLVSGFASPSWGSGPCQNIIITEGETSTLSGSTFTALGWLHVSTNPGVPGVITVDGIVRDGWGTWLDVPPGSHQVCFGDVPGRTTPACQTVTVTAGATTNVVGNYS